MRVAVVGLGRMGSAIARRVEEAGHELAVWNRSAGPADEFAARGAERLGAPADARAADVVLTMLSDSAAVEAVLLGPDGVLRGQGQATLVEMSTISVESSARIAAEADRCASPYLRAPVSGNPAVVAAGNLGIIVSGPRERFEAVAPVLSDIGGKLFYVGPAEQARAVKLAANLMIAGTAQLMAEAVVLGERNGIDARQMLEVLGESAIGSPFLRYKTDALVADDYAATFTTRLMYKDLALALECANGSGVPLPLTAITQQLLQACVSTGMGGDDFMSLVPRLRKEAG